MALVNPGVPTAGADVSAAPILANFEGIDVRLVSVENVIANVTVDARTYGNGVFPSGLAASQVGTTLQYSAGVLVNNNIIYSKSVTIVEFAGQAANTYYVEADSAGDFDIYTSKSVARTNLNTVVWNGTGFTSVTEADRTVLATYQEIIDARGTFDTLEERLDDSDDRLDGIEDGTAALTKVLTPEIKTDTTTPTDLAIVTGAAKTLVLSTVVYDDIIIQAANLRVGTTPPTFATFQDSIYGIKFINAQTDIVYGAFEIPHDYKEGTDLTIHLHWSPDSTDTGNCVWDMRYTIAAVNGTFGSEVTRSFTQAGSGTINAHQLVNANAVISGSGVVIGTIIAFALSRPAGDAFTGDAFLHSVGVHYQIDTMGSRGIATK